MKKIVLCIIAFLTCITMGLRAQISTCSWHDGYWGEWKTHTTRYTYNPPTCEFSLYGNYSGFIIYKKDSHPSEFLFKFETISYTEPDNQTIKYHLKKDVWYEYSGFVEYYVTENYPTILAILRTFEFPCFNCNSGSEGNPCVKRRAEATIRIAPYKKHPKCYNIHFDNVAIGIDLETSYFMIN